MAAVLRQGARRLGGSVLQRTQAAFTSPAVGEERRRLVPWHMHTDQHACARPDAMQKTQLHMKEELYEALSKAKPDKSFITNCRNRLLLQHLSPHVRRPYDAQWRWLRVSKVAHNMVRMAGVISCACMLATGYKRYVAGEEILAQDKQEQ